MFIRSALACAFALPTLAQPPHPYTEVGRFDRGVDTLDLLPDGRIVGLSGDSILVQTAINANTYTQLATIQPGFVSSFGASFISISPDGTHAAIGDNVFGGPSDATVGIFDLATGTLQTSFAAPNFSAVWTDNQTLFVAGGSTSDTNLVTRFDLNTQTAATVINDTAGFSGAIATDGTSLLATNGFSIGGPDDSQTGEVRAFDLSILDGTQTLSFENDGVFVARALSAGSLDFDAAGNLVIGGANATVDAGVIAIVSPSGERIDIASPFNTDFNLARFNDATGEILILGSSEIVRYRPIPAPHTALALAGLLALRRRRHA